MKNNIKMFGSDNFSAVHPRIMEALHQANTGHTHAYGDDGYTQKALSQLKRLFGKSIDAYFVYNGTGANVLGIQTVTQSFHSILCAESAHINVDECGAVEKFTGCKLIPIHTKQGKLTVADITPLVEVHGVEHHSQPGVVSISQATEYGTVYTPDQISALSECAHSHKMFLHMDGARLANAAAYLRLSLADISFKAGVDILSLGGTKNGLMFGEALIFNETVPTDQVKYIRKQGMHLASKMRYIAVQFSALLQDNLWLENSLQANAMAQTLADHLQPLDYISITHPVESNAVFAQFPKSIIQPMQKESFFHVWDKGQSVVRLMCSFDTTQEDITDFIQVLEKCYAQYA